MRALIVRFSAIGDCVMAVPVATSIRRALPTAEIWWAVEPRCEAVIDCERLVDKKVLFDRVRWKRNPGPAVWREQLLAYSRMRRAHFDIGIDLQGHSKSAIALRIAAPKKRVAAQGFDAIARAMNPVVEGDRNAFHTVEWELHALRALGDFSTEARWTMPELKEERAEVQTLLTRGVPLATINVATGWADKNYPLERWVQIGRHLRSRGFQVAYVGGPGETGPPDSEGLNLVGSLPLAKTMAVVAMSAIHLAGDTGSGHIAAAYGVPSVSIFGPSNPEHFRPYSPATRVLRNGTVPSAVSVPCVVEAIESILEPHGQALSD